MKPGNTLFIRMPAGPYRSAKSFTKALSPARSAEETGKASDGSTAPKVEMFTMAPPPCRSMSGVTRRARRTV